MTPAQCASQVKPLSAGPEQQTTFTAFPKGTLLESDKVPIAEIALCDGPCTNPIYRVHRGFARRLGSQFRAILAGLSLTPEEADRFWSMYLGHLSLDGAVVLDPFVGGGTSLVEAERCGARVVGYDIDPVAKKGETTASRTAFPSVLIATLRLNTTTISIQEDVSFPRASFGSIVTHGSRKSKR